MSYRTTPPLPKNMGLRDFVHVRHRIKNKNSPTPPPPPPKKMGLELLSILDAGLKMMTLPFPLRPSDILWRLCCTLVGYRLICHCVCWFFLTLRQISFSCCLFLLFWTKMRDSGCAFQSQLAHFNPLVETSNVCHSLQQIRNRRLQRR